MLSVSDVFKKSFLEGYASGSISVMAICVCMAISVIFGVYIFVAHRLMTRKSFYDKNFGMSLVAMTLITAAVVLTIQESIVVSLGMVGALSIVRFRNAIKNPMDIVYLFWAISCGIICGAGFAEIAVVLCLVLTVVMLVLDQVPVAKASMLLVINASDYDVEDQIQQIVKKYSNYNKVKSRNLSRGHLDEVIEVRVKDGASCVRELMEVKGIEAASLLEHDGEVSF